MFPEVFPSRYDKYIQQCHAGQPYREGVVVGKGKRATGPTVQKVPVKRLIAKLVSMSASVPLTHYI